MERDLEYVYAVYQMGSFSKAAKFLFASQPTVSMAVQRVEEDLGYPVFDRQSHPLRLTAAGERFIQHVERVRESEKALRTEIDKIYRQEEEILRIGCSPLKSSYLMPEVIAKFHSLEPDTEVVVVNSFRQGLLRDLQNHKVDIVINTFLETNNTDFTYIPACEVHYLLGVPADCPINRQLKDFALSGRDIIEGKHLLRECLHVPISVFAETQFVDFSGGSEFYEQSRKIFEESGFKPRVKVTVSSPVMAHAMAMTGIGATIVGDYMVMEDSPLLYYHLRTRWERRAFYFVLRKEHQLTRKQQLFIELLRKYMSERGQEENP